MFIGARPASVPIQIAALVLAIPGGLMLFSSFVSLLTAFVPGAQFILIWLCIAACAYFLAAPATWRGLFRRALVVLGVSLLTYAALGYVFEFAGLRIEGAMPEQEPQLQVSVLLVGVVALAGSRVLRDRRRPPAPEVPPKPETEPSSRTP